MIKRRPSQQLQDEMVSKLVAIDKAPGANLSLELVSGDPTTGAWRIVRFKFFDQKAYAAGEFWSDAEFDVDVSENDMANGRFIVWALGFCASNGLNMEIVGVESYTLAALRAVAFVLGSQ